MREKLKNLLSTKKKKVCGIVIAVVLFVIASVGGILLYGESNDALVAKASQTSVHDDEKNSKSKLTDQEKKDSEIAKKVETEGDAESKKIEKDAKSETKVKAENKKSSGSENKNSDSKDAAKQTTSSHEKATPVQNQEAASQDSTIENETGNSNHVNASTPDQPKQPEPVWHEPVYENKWVVDQAAWTEEVPIYETKEIAVCNTCGADISGFAGEHILDGDCTGYHSEVIQVQVGTNTISHPEQGHYEPVLVKDGYWE